MFGHPPLLSFGCVSDPSVAPTLVSVVDNGDQDAVTATITGSGTIQLYYRIRGTSVWTTGLTRTDSGTIVQTGLTENNWYEFYATADQNGIESAPSGIVSTFIAGTAVPGIERAIFSILTDDVTVSGLVGTRVFPVYVPQNANMPCITQQQLSGPRDNTLDGPSGLVDARFQINCWGSTYIEADDVFEAVRKALSGFLGTVLGVEIQSSDVEDEGDLTAIKAGVDKLRRIGKRLDIRIMFIESP
jgi:hypothetical protein